MTSAKENVSERMLFPSRSDMYKQQSPARASVENKPHGFARFRHRRLALKQKKPFELEHVWLVDQSSPLGLAQSQRLCQAIFRIVLKKLRRQGFSSSEFRCRWSGNAKLPRPRNRQG